MEIWVCEVSPIQRCFHVDTLERVLETNRVTAERGTNPGYIPLYVGLSREAASDYANQWRQLHPDW